MKFGLVVLVGLLGLGQVAHAFTAEALLGLAVFAKVVNLVIRDRKKCLKFVNIYLKAGIITAFVFDFKNQQSRQGRVLL